MKNFTYKSFFFQVAFWTVYIIIWYYIFQVDAENDPEMLDYLVSSFAIGQIFQANLTNYWLIPYYFNRKKYIVFASWIVFISALSAQTVYWTIDFLPGELDDYSATYNDWIDIFAPIIVISLFINAMVITLRLSYDRYKSDRLTEQLEKEKLAAELKFLKAQINPHFLFNSINMIFHLIDQDPQKSKSSLAKFSDILRYHLYQSADEIVPLSDEIEHVRNYVELEKLRRGKMLEVELDIGTSLGYLEIVPLVLLSFVENAFKHISTHLKEKNWINISIQKNQNHLEIRVENSKREKKLGQPKNYGGIGLTNIRKRLELTYGSTHSLDVTDSEDSFQVLLKIEVT